MRFVSTGIFADPIWRRVLSDWHEDLTYWLRHGLPRVLLILIVAFILTRLLGFLTAKLYEFSKRDELPSRLRATQLRTLSSIIDS